MCLRAWNRSNFLLGIEANPLVSVQIAISNIESNLTVAEEHQEILSKPRISCCFELLTRYVSWLPRGYIPCEFYDCIFCKIIIISLLAMGTGKGEDDGVQNSTFDAGVSRMIY